MKHLPANLTRSIVKNVASQIGGRLLITLSRLLIAILIVRYGSTELFGQYTLVLSLLFVAEWLVDFGMTDIGVRNICQQPDRKYAILRVLAYLKIPQFVFAYALLLGFVLLMGYEPVIVRATLLGGIGLVCYAGAVVYRILFRVDMCMERDVAGELAGVLFMMPLIWYASSKGAGVDILVACYAASRVVFFAVAVVWGGRQVRLDTGGLGGNEAKMLIQQALPLGVAGAMVTVYESTAPVVLSRLMDMQAVAFYSLAMRFMLPIVIATHSIARTFFPVLSSYWKKSDSKFHASQQNALEVSFLFAGAFLCIFNAAAEFFMGLIGRELGDAAYLLRILSWAILARAVTAAMYPLIVISGKQAKVLGLTLLTVLANVTLVLWLVPVYGVVGVAIAFVVIEFVFSMIPTILISQHAASVRMNWFPLLKVFLSAVLALACTSALGQTGTFWGGAVAVLLYFAFAAVTGVFSISKLRRILESTKRSQSGMDSLPGES